MKFDKDFKPGQNNTYNEYNIQHIENFNPNATTVTTTHNHYGEEKSSGCGRKKLDDSEKEAIREDILDYVGLLVDYVRDEWKAKYKKLWESILALPEVDAKIYNKGRQKKTTFNKYLVGNILCLLIDKVLDGNPTDFCRILEGSEKHRVRQEMGLKPTKKLEEAVLKLLE